MKMTRSTVNQKVDFDRYELDNKLTKVIARLQEVLAGIPEEYRDSADMDVSAYDEYGSSYVSVEITYRRPETDQEMEAREFREEAYRKASCERDLAEFERLKAKFAKGAA